MSGTFSRKTRRLQDALLWKRLENRSSTAGLPRLVPPAIVTGNSELVEVESRLKRVLLAWRQETHDPLLGEEYFRKLKEHTDRHPVWLAGETAKAKASGRPAPVNRIDMTEFQERWPTPRQ